MIVVAIIGILAAIAIPKFASLIRKSSEGATKGNLGSIRSAITIYYGDMEGQYPSDPSALTVGGKYLASIPTVKTPNYHANSTQVTLWTAGNWQDTGGWIYDANTGNANFGSVFVDCTDTDSKFSIWTSY